MHPHTSTQSVLFLAVVAAVVAGELDAAARVVIVALLILSAGPATEPVKPPRQ